MVVLAGVVVGSVLTWVRPEESMATQVTAQVGILVAAGGAILGLIKLMPSLQTWPMGNAVGELRDGGAAVGRVVRIGWRHLICPSGMACTVLHISDGDAQELVPGRHLTVYFPAGSSGRGGGGVEAKVVAWGPGLRRLGRPKLAVLRTARPLPSAIPRLSLARHPHRGRAHVLLADPGGAPSAAAGPAGTMNGTELTITQVLPPDAAGAPILAGGPDANTGPVVAFVAAEAGGQVGQVPVPPPGTGRSVPLVAADDAQLLLDSVNRRQALKFGAVGAVVAVGGGTFLAIRSREHPKVIKGAGWRDLFNDPLVKAGLATELRAVPDLEASAYTYDVKQMSGVESLSKLTPQLLREYDFVTCPNDAVRKSLEAKIRDAGRTSEANEFCRGWMVLLVRRNAVQALQKADLLTSFERRKAGEPDVRFDVQAYLSRYGNLPTWDQADTDFDGRNSGSPIKIEFSDPSQAGGGELFLAMLRHAQTDLQLKGEPGNAERLWGEDGPLRAYGAKTTKLLLRTFLDGGPQQMVFVYEHDVIAALMEKPERAKNYVLLRTSFEAFFTQFVISLSPAGRVVGEALMGRLAPTLCQQFKVRAIGRSDDVDQLLARPVLAEARNLGVHVTRRASTGARTVEFAPSDLDDLVSRMSTPAPTSP